MCIRDRNERNFHGYTTDRGSTYNAYLIMDEQVTLIDTCKPAFAGELIERISEVVDPACIEHVIVNHVEQDHSGAVPAISYLAPRANIYASGPHGVNAVSYTHLSTPMMPFAPMLFAGMPMSSSSLRAKSWLPPSASTVCMIMTTGSISICDRFDR